VVVCEEALFSYSLGVLRGVVVSFEETPVCLGVLTGVTVLCKETPLSDLMGVVLPTSWLMVHDDSRGMSENISQSTSCLGVLGVLTGLLVCALPWLRLDDRSLGTVTSSSMQRVSIRAERV
jgi:hypothetical protein